MRTWILAAGLLVASVGACREGSTPPAEPAVTLTFWHTFNAPETEVVNARIAAFEAANPGIRVQASAIPFGSAQSRIKEAFARGTAPDAFRIETAWTPEFAQLGIPLPATWLPEAEREDLLPEAAALFSVEGQLYAAPHSVDCLALLYDRRRLDEAGIAVPATYEELVHAGKSLTDPAKGKHGLFVRGDGYWFLPFLWGNGADFVGKDGAIALDRPEAVAALEAYVALSKSGATERWTDWATEYRRMMRTFSGGEVAMIFNGPWGVSEILEGTAFGGDPAKLGIAPIPAGNAGFATPIGGHGYAVMSRTAHPAEAAALARFLASPDSQAAFAASANVLPARRSVYERRDVQANPVIAPFRLVLATGRLRPTDPEIAYIHGTLDSAVQRALEDVLPPREGLSAVAKQWRDRRALEAKKTTKPGAPPS